MAIAAPIGSETSSRCYVTDNDRWDAVARRDPAADGAFFYSVETTGVYCRPSCASRLPRRENVHFHSTCEAAEEAGFRPCKRCRPADSSPALAHALAIANACRTLQEAENLPDLDHLAAAAGMSRFHFQRVFKAVAGVTPRAYFAQNRAARMRDQLMRTGTVTEAIYGAGFNSNSRFYEASSETLGMTPTAFRSGGTGTSIRFAIGQCSLGAILVAATERGVCSILLGADPAELLRNLEKRFPKAELIGGDAEFEQWVATVIGFVEAPAQPFHLPLDIRGTVFQRRVWEALREIPVGSTASYTEIAHRIGAPQAVRAVARACSSNPLAVAIPCHRVVRQDGSLSGYRWGLERKRTLLERESGA